MITPTLILDETAKMFGWTVDDLCGKSRRRPLVTARQIGMYVFRELTDFSYPQIAEEFGGRDHTTVMHACEKIKRADDRAAHQVFDQVNELISRIRHGDRWITLWMLGISASRPVGDAAREPRRVVFRALWITGGESCGRPSGIRTCGDTWLSTIHSPYY